MTNLSLWNKYLERYAVGDKWQLNAGNTENISQIVVIPAYAEKEMLFATLGSIADNQPSSLAETFILCVINNKKKSPADAKINNQQTLEYLRFLVDKKSLPSLCLSDDLKRQLQLIADARLRLGYIDASSEGGELPDDAGGVGLARKIGMDNALILLKKSSARQKLIISLDADTLVQSNYLAAIRNGFTKKIKTAVVAYEHQEPQDNEEKAAIYCYETFLRYWRLGLQYAKSPYSYHAIGSTMICSADAYLAVRGMNRREAGEDFYFLNKLAKIGSIKYIKDTCVHPSARSSLRVPFGTGKRIHRHLNGVQDEYLLYNPQVFEIMAAWLLLMENSFAYAAEEIVERAKLIDPCLASFLKDCNFTQAWSNIRNNAKNEDKLIYQFKCWFDGFKTLKLINYLSRGYYPPVNMFTAVATILKMQKIAVPENISFTNLPQLAEQKNILQFLRRIT